MAKKSLVKLLLCLVLVIGTVGMAAANGPELMVYSGTIPQGVNQGDRTYEISFSIYASEKGGSALWTETQDVYVYQGAFAVYLGAVQKLNLAFDLPYWVGVKVGGKEDIWPLTGAGYPIDVSGEATLSVETDGTSPGTHAPSLALVANEVLSANIKEADNSSGQNTNSGAGIKAGHIQNGAVTTSKIHKDAVTTPKLADGAVTDAKITGPISASKISSTGLNADTLDGFDSTAFMKKAGDGQISSGATLVAGNNFVYGTTPATVTPAVNGTCLVMITSQIDTGAPVATQGPFFRIAVKTNGTDGNDGAYGHYFPVVTAGTVSDSLSRSSLINVTGGTIYQFGCFYGSVDANWTHFANCRVSFVCF